jgi:penicillin-binding protein 1A
MIVSIETPEGDIIYKATKTTAKRILAEETSELMNSMLQKAINSGTGVAIRSTYGVNLPLAGKTGTSQNYADAWFIAYNPEIVIATRVGASSPAIHFNSGAYGSGSKLALPIVALCLQSSQKDRVLLKKINAPFQVLSPALVDALNCPDYMEDTVLEKLFDSFRKETTTSKKKSKKAKKKKKKGFFERIFK